MPHLTTPDQMNVIAPTVSFSSVGQYPMHAFLLYGLLYSMHVGIPTTSGKHLEELDTCVEMIIDCCV